MRRVAVLLASALAVAGAAHGVGASTGAPRAPTGAAKVLDLGDSLSVGTAPYLRARLRGYRLERVHDVGLHAYDAAAIVTSAGASLPPVVVVSAGTNDDPRIVSTFIRAISRIVSEAGAERCVVWPTIVRPPAGKSYDAMNRALARAAARHRNLVLVDWVGMVRRNSRWLSGDGVHVSVAGYRARAAAIARAIRVDCAQVIG